MAKPDGKSNFDLVVIGAGMAGVNVANKCASAGWQVAVVDELPYGGTCALRGCDPKKILRRGAEIVDAARLFHGKGIEEGGLRINWRDLIVFKRTFTDKMPGRIEKGFQSSGVHMFKGTIQFVDGNSVSVNGEILHGEKFLIATGAEPRPLGIPGEELLTYSDQFMELEALPKRIVFIGGGFISMEFSHIANRAGASVTVFDHGDRPLKGFDPDLVKKLVERSTNLGINFKFQTELNAIEKKGKEFKVHYRDSNGEGALEADLVVHGAGRIPAIGRLNLKAADITFGPKGILVNEYMQSTSNSHVYAAGDTAASPGAPLTPVAVFEGKVAASNMLKGNKAVPDYRGIPSAVFTIPELTRIGLLEQEAKNQGLDFHVKFTDTSGWYSNFRVGETCAGAKVLIDKKTQEIIGAHLLGPESAELINFFSLAMRLNIPATGLRKMVSAYPSVGSDLGSMV